MNRRKAIGRIFLFTGISIAGYSGYKFWDWNKKPDLDFLSQQKDLIAALAETIIPASDSPGAKEAGVEQYIITMIKDCTERKSQNKFIDGLKALNHYCKSQFNKPFDQCTEKEKQQTLQHFEEMGKSSKGLIGKAEDRYLGKSFFSTLKTYTIQGYCSSEMGATKGLSYLYIPGKFVGCMPLQPGQKAWATK
jgi:hypothetical protein